MSIQDGFVIEKPLGENSADNSMDSSLVTANEDGSGFERLEHIQRVNNNLVKKVLTTIANGATTLFNYTGNIRIKAIYGVVTKIMENKVQNCKLSIKPDALAAYDICANKDLDTFAVGSLISITGTAANSALSTTEVGTLAPFQASEIIATSIAAGIITTTAGAANTGAITWYVQWEPLSDGATLTAV